MAFLMCRVNSPSQKSQRRRRHSSSSSYNLSQMHARVTSGDASSLGMCQKVLRKADERGGTTGVSANCKQSGSDKQTAANLANLPPKQPYLSHDRVGHCGGDGGTQHVHVALAVALRQQQQHNINACTHQLHQCTTHSPCCG